MTTTTDTTKKVTIRANAFGRVETIRCLVDDDGSVLVWDDVAGHYTRCNRLGASAISRIRKLADAISGE